MRVAPMLLSILMLSCAVAAQTPTLNPKNVEFKSTVRLIKLVEYDLLGVKMASVEQNRQGTGVIIAVGEVNKKVVTLMLTAKHVISTESEFSDNELVVMNVSFHVNDQDGRTAKAELVACHNVVDVCMLAIDGEFGEPADMAKADPTMGSTVFHVGAPAGQFNKGIAFVSEGRFGGKQSYQAKIKSGKEVKDFTAWMSLSSAPTFPGSSGGGLWYNHQLLGLTVKINGPMTWSVDRTHVAEFYNQAWQVYYAFKMKKAVEDAVKQ